MNEKMEVPEDTSAPVDKQEMAALEHVFLDPVEGTVSEQRAPHVPGEEVYPSLSRRDQGPETPYDVATGTNIIPAGLGVTALVGAGALMVTKGIGLAAVGAALPFLWPAVAVAAAITVVIPFVGTISKMMGDSAEQEARNLFSDMSTDVQLAFTLGINDPAVKKALREYDDYVSMILDGSVSAKDTKDEWENIKQNLGQSLKAAMAESSAELRRPPEEVAEYIKNNMKDLNFTPTAQELLQKGYYTFTDEAGKSTGQRSSWKSVTPGMVDREPRGKLAGGLREDDNK